MTRSCCCHLILLLTLTILLAGCSKQELPHIPEQGTILAFGDSLTAGVGVGRSNSYPQVLAQLSKRTVINAGLSGEVTADGLERLTGILEENHPDLLILLEGGNDILHNLNPNETRNNLSAMISLAKARNIPVVLIGVPEKNLFSKSAPLYRELAEQHRIILIGGLIAELLKKPGYKSDQLHFNEKGYRAMAEAIHRVLVDHGAL